MSLKHPVDRGATDHRRPFDRFAQLRAEHAIQARLDAVAKGLREVIGPANPEAGAMLEGAIGREEHV